MGVVIEMKNVTYHYPLTDAPAIKDLSLKIEKGKFYGIAGGNGSGKTTLCALMRGFIPEFYKGSLEGEALIYGKSAADYGEGELSRRIGYVFQNPFNQISGVRETLFEEVAFGLENFGVPVDEIERRVEDAMKLADIWELAEKNPFELSGGQSQRAALASMIVLEPDVFILDEPTSQLDPESTESIFGIIAGMKKAGKTVILAEHKTDLIAEHADEVLALHGGELVRSGPAWEVLSDMSLSGFGIRPPQAAVLCAALKERGLDLPYIPVTETQCEEVLRGLIGREG